MTETILLRWKNGVYVAEPGQGTFEQLAREAEANQLFLTLLRRFTKQSRNVSDKSSPSYAPSLFAKEPEAKKSKPKVTADALADAMRRLFAAGKIEVVSEGPPSRIRTRIVEAAPVIVTPPPTASNTPFQRPKSGQNENEPTVGSRQATCAATTGTSEPSNAPSNDLPTPSNGLSTHTPHTPQPVGRGQEALEAAPSNGQDHGTIASVPFMITRAMREQLNQCGVSDDEIADLTPQQAHDIISRGLPPSDYRGEKDH